MSAFMVQTETIQLAVQAMHAKDTPIENADQLGRRFMRMNRDAVCFRYPLELTPEQVAPDIEIEAFRFRNPGAGRMAMLVACECLLYQCSEGDVPKLQLYAELKETVGRLAREIVHASPEYYFTSKKFWK